MYPLSLDEITSNLQSPTELSSLLPQLLNFGSYPKIFTSITDALDPQKELEKIT
jgi:hypothetical protein